MLGRKDRCYMLPLTIWMNMPSFYQDDLFRDLAGKVDLRVIYDHGLTEDRRQLGWSDPKPEYPVRVLGSERKIRQARSIALSETDRVHVINGIWAESSFMAAAYALGRVGARFAIYSECPDETLSRSLVRRGARSLAGHWVARRAQGLFAVSHLAVDYFDILGFRPDGIYPFGYFRKSETVHPISSSGIVDLVYVGQLIHRKGIDILLEAMAPLWESFPLVRLSLVGAGPEGSSIVAWAQRQGLADRVILEGSSPSSQIQQRLAEASVLVLPSRWDGWGLVINEALAAGTPVIASDRCGASDLIARGVNGYVFRSEDVGDLRACLSTFLNSDSGQMRLAALRTASALTIPSVSNYFVECLEHMCGLKSKKPAPPWKEILRQLESEPGVSDCKNYAGLPDMASPKQKSA